MCITCNIATDPEQLAAAVRAHLTAASVPFIKFVPSRVQAKIPTSAIFLTLIPTGSANLEALTKACDEQLSVSHPDLHYFLESGRFPTLGQSSELNQMIPQQKYKKGPRNKLEEATVIKGKCLPAQVANCTIAFRALFNPERPKKDIPHCLAVLTVN